MRKLILIIALLIFSGDIYSQVTHQGSFLNIYNTIVRRDAGGDIIATTVNAEAGYEINGVALASLDNVLWVDISFSAVTSTGSINRPYSTISDAITASASGDLILVVPGTYSEHLTITQTNISIIGVGGSEVTFLEALQSGGTGIDLVDYTLIKGFTLTSDAAGTIIQLDAGETGVQILDNVINSTGAATFGIVGGTSGSDEFLVQGNTFRTNSGDGAIWLEKNHTNTIIDDNYFFGADSTSGYAIQTAGINVARFSDNVIEGFASGIFPHTATTASSGTYNIVIEGNSIKHTANAIRLGHSSQTVNMDSVFVFNNTLYENNRGIFIDDDATILVNTFSIVDNRITDNTTNYNNNHSSLVPYALSNFIGADFTSTGSVEGGSLTDGTATLTGGAWTGLTSLAIDNLLLDGNTFSSTAGTDLLITPLAGEDVIIDGHFEFDGNLLTAITDNNTILAAYAGKNITIESVTFDNNVVTATSFVGALTGNASTATALQNPRTIGGVSFDGTANITVASATGGFAITGDLNTTGARVTKGWFIDLEVTNAIAGAITGNAATATALENPRTIGGVSFNGTANITVASATGGFTVTGALTDGTFSTTSGVFTGMVSMTDGTASWNTSNLSGFGTISATGNLTLDNTGATVNSPIIYLRGDQAGTEQEATIQLLQGNNEYLRLSVDNSSEVLTPVMDMRSDLVSWFNGDAGIDYYFNFNGENNDGTITYMEDEDGFQFGEHIYLPEITTPTAIADFGAIYTKTDNLFYFQDGAGVEKVLSPSPAYSSIWYHGGESTTAIGTQNLFHQVVDFENVGEEDASSNTVGDPVTDNDLVIGTNGAGVYELCAQSSFRNSGGGSTNMLIAPGITLATPIAITSSTDATPIVVTTSGAHGLKSGDMIRIAGHATNVAANTDCLINVTDATHFELKNLSNANIAGSGGGAGSGGNVDVVFPGNAVVHRIVSQTDLGRGMATGTYRLSASDIVEFYVADLGGTSNFISVNNVFCLTRIDI